MSNFKFFTCKSGDIWLDVAEVACVSAPITLEEKYWFKANIPYYRVKVLMKSGFISYIDTYFLDTAERLVKEITNV